MNSQIAKMIAYTFPLLGLIILLPACNGLEIDEASPPDEWEMDGFESILPLTINSGTTLECEESHFSWIKDLGIYPTPQLGEPTARVPFRDPVFHTCLLRVTNRKTDIPTDDSSGGFKNEYSRAQSFNADGSLLIARSTEARWYLYDASSLKPLGELPLNVEPRWDASDPYRIYHFDETRLILLDLETGQTQIVHEFADDFPDQTLAAVWTRYEGSPTFDGRYWGLMAQDEEWRVIALLVYDLEQDQVIGTRELRGQHEIDAVSISPLGTYYLAYYDVDCEEDQIGNADHPCGLMVYDRNLLSGRSVVPVIGHSDTAVDSQGREVVAFQDIQQDEISFVDLESGQITPLFPIDFSHSPIGLHFSGRASEKPGWILILIRILVF